LFRSLRRFYGDQVKKDVIFDYLEALEKGELANGLRLAEDDVILFWCVTHGGSKEGEIDLYFHNDAEPLKRSELVEKLKFGGRRRLAVIITENCSDEIAGVPRPLASDANASSVWKSLYFGHSGTVDITSSSQGQEALNADGSIFTEGFKRSFDELRNPKEILIDRNNDGFVDWVDEFFPTLQDQTRFRFDEAHRTLIAKRARNSAEEQVLEQMERQKTQTPQFRLPSSVAPFLTSSGVG